MARMRTVKPEFWTSEQVVACSPMARLLFIGLWNFCDDAGNHPASFSRLKMEVFPGDATPLVDIEGFIAELVAQGLLLEYEADGQQYWHVTGWKKHQKIEKPTRKHPEPSPPSRQQFGDSSPTPPRALGPGKEGRGEESKGEETIGAAHARAADEPASDEGSKVVPLARRLDPRSNEGFPQAIAAAGLSADELAWLERSAGVQMLKPEGLDLGLRSKILSLVGMAPEIRQHAMRVADELGAGSPIGCALDCARNPAKYERRPRRAAGGGAASYELPEHLRYGD